MEISWKLGSLVFSVFLYLCPRFLSRANKDTEEKFQNYIKYELRVLKIYYFFDGKSNHVLYIKHRNIFGRPPKLERSMMRI